jgi:hypothetical protein
MTNLGIIQYLLDALLVIAVFYLLGGTHRVSPYLRKESDKLRGNLRSGLDVQRLIRHIEPIEPGRGTLQTPSIIVCLLPRNASCVRVGKRLVALCRANQPPVPLYWLIRQPAQGEALRFAGQIDLPSEATFALRDRKVYRRRLGPQGACFYFDSTSRLLREGPLTSLQDFVTLVEGCPEERLHLWLLDALMYQNSSGPGQKSILADAKGTE